MHVFGSSTLKDLCQYYQKMLLGQLETLCMENVIPSITQCHHQKCMYVYVCVCICLNLTCIVCIWLYWVVFVCICMYMYEFDMYQYVCV